jgi:hypothetical protein
MKRNPEMTHKEAVFKALGVDKKGRLNFSRKDALK